MKRSYLRALVLVLLCNLFTGTTATRADTLVNWIGPTGMGGNGNWSTAADWSDHVVPNNVNGHTYAVTLPSYINQSSLITVNISATIDSLAVDDSNELNGYGPHTLTTGALTISSYGEVFFTTTRP